MSNDVKNVSVRFPADLHARISHAAKTERRSFNAEVLVLIERALQGQDRRDSPRP